MSDETTTMALIRAVITQTRGRAMWLQQHVPIEAIMPRQAAKQAAGEAKDDQPKIRADNFKQTGGYGYQLAADGIAGFAVTGLLVPIEYAGYFYSDEITIYDLLARDVAAAMNDPEVKGALFFNNSPGGFVDGAYELADTIAALSAAKPTATFGKSIVASAAYLQAAMTGRITAFKTAEVGSIGTRSAIYDYHRMFERFGIEAIPLDSGGMKSAGLPGTQISKEQIGYWQGLIDKLNQFFVDAVAKARSFSAEKMKSIADGRVHVAADAMSIGLIDAVGTMADAMKELRQRVAKKPGGNAIGNTVVASPFAQLLQAAPIAGEQAINEINTAEEPPGESADAGASASGSELQAAAEEKENHMSGSNPTAAAGTTPPAGQSSNEPKAANMADLKAGCPGAPSDFLVEQSEKGATLAQAKDAYLQFQSAQIRARDEQLKKLEDEQKQQTTTARRPGVAPIESAGDRRAAEGASSNTGAAAIAELETRIDTLVQRRPNVTRENAAAMILSEDDDLRERYVAEKNEQRSERIASRGGRTRAA